MKYGILSSSFLFTPITAIWAFINNGHTEGGWFGHPSENYVNGGFEAGALYPKKVHRGNSKKPCRNLDLPVTLFGIWHPFTHSNLLQIIIAATWREMEEQWSYDLSKLFIGSRTCWGIWCRIGTPSQRRWFGALNMQTPGRRSSSASQSPSHSLKHQLPRR